MIVTIGLTLGPCLFISGIVELFLYRMGVFYYFDRPISSVLFGANKRWRGLVSLPLLTSIFMTICCGSMSFWTEHDISPGWLGFLSGLVWNLSELPNSIIKRHILKIAPGGGDDFWFCIIMDHLDSTSGLCLLLHFVYSITWIQILPIIFISGILHFINHQLKERL